jgi:protoporphyrinogen oxidase
MSPGPRHETRFLILGAGPTGLGAAWRLRELDIDDFLVLEATDHVGGLASSFTDAHGFTWDIGGHVQFSHYRYFDELMERALGPGGWLHHQRESWAWLRGSWVPYPVQYNLHRLPAAEREACLKGLEAASAAAVRAGPGAPPPAHFGEWIQRTFGEGLAQVFLRPYNFKVWGWPVEELASHWVGDRVAVPDLERVKRTIATGVDDVSWGPNHTFRFPKKGGTGAIWEAVADLVGRERIRLSSPVMSVDPTTRIVECNDGRRFGYTHLLSTVPLDSLVALLGSHVSAEFARQASRLRYSSTHIVGLGLRGPPPESLRTRCWMYFSEPDCPFYRVTLFSNYSPANAPADHWSLMTETSETPRKPVDRARIVEDAVEGALTTGLISRREDLVSTWSMTVAHGYPTPSLERDAALDFLLPALDALGISSRGRFGAWKYEVSNQDHSLMQGVEWVNWKLHGEPEVTVRDPARVNAPGKR